MAEIKEVKTCGVCPPGGCICDGTKYMPDYAIFMDAKLQEWKSDLNVGYGALYNEYNTWLTEHKKPIINKAVFKSHLVDDLKLTYARVRLGAAPQGMGFRVNIHELTKIIDDIKARAKHKSTVIDPRIIKLFTGIVISDEQLKLIELVVKK